MEFNIKNAEGKTIKRIDNSACNMLLIEFTDGTTIEIFAECGSGDFAIPFFDIYRK